MKAFLTSLVLWMVMGGRGKEAAMPLSDAMSATGPLVFDELVLIDGLEVKDFNRRRCIQLKDGVNTGEAAVYFFDASASYDLTLYYADEADGQSEVSVKVNDRPAGTITFNQVKKGSSFTFAKKTLRAVNLQQGSRISLQFTGNGKEKCRVEKIVLEPRGPFRGSPEKLENAPTLQVFETAAEIQEGRDMLPRFVNGKIEELMNARLADLSRLKTPEQWQQQQEKTRAELETFFGQFPDRTPLNVKITGRIDHENYSIEKLYFESRPRYFVTANLYLPRNRRLPVPGVLFTCGHSTNGKNNLLYHSACLGLVLKGYAVLALDPMGQGERIEYFDSSHNNILNGAVDQHYYLGRPSFLVNRTLSGLRVWDATRALDYLVSRPEVDTLRLAAVGNSGGGQMALMMTAVDQRIKVCAAGHPGGEMEKNYLPGQNLIDRQIFSLIAPRPVRIIVGDRSGEEPPHRKKIEDMQLFMEGLGYSKEMAEIKMVDGVHDLRQPKREAVYEWLNRWFHKEEEGTTEPPLTPEEEKDLWVTPQGLTLVSLGGETGQTLNRQELEKHYRPATDHQQARKRIAKRIGLSLPADRGVMKRGSSKTFAWKNYQVEKLRFQTETGIEVPAVLIRPKLIRPGASVYVYISDKGKPVQMDETSTPFQLAAAGHTVLAIDVRGTGETSPTASLPEPAVNSGCTPRQWIHDCLAIQSPGFGRTMLAMRAYDVIRSIDFLSAGPGLPAGKVNVYGEGQGGLWALVASVFDPRIDILITDGTLVSYKPLVSEKYYAVSSDYFWVPGALNDFDIPDLAHLAAARKQVWVDPVNGLNEKLNAQEATSIIGADRNIHIVSPKKNATTDLQRLFLR